VAGFAELHPRSVYFAGNFCITLAMNRSLHLSRAVASEAICKWGGGRMPARSAGRNVFDVPPHFSLVPPTWGGTTIICYRLGDNWSREVGRAGPSTYSYTHTHSISSAPIRLQEGHGCITSKMIKYSYWTLNRIKIVSFKKFSKVSDVGFRANVFW